MSHYHDEICLMHSIPVLTDHAMHCNTVVVLALTCAVNEFVQLVDYDLGGTVCCAGMAMQHSATHRGLVWSGLVPLHWPCDGLMGQTDGYEAITVLTLLIDASSLLQPQALTGAPAGLPLPVRPPCPPPCSSSTHDPSHHEPS